MFSHIAVVMVLASSLLGQAGDPDKREQVGELLGKPVYRDEIHVGKDVSLSSEARRLFVGPLMEQYRAEHREEIAVTPAEIEAVTKHLSEQHKLRINDTEADLRQQLAEVEAKLTGGTATAEEQRELQIKKQVLQVQLDPPHRSVAEFLLSGWKLQRHLYDNFGGGRIVWQQGGIEAFDATRKWLESCEAAGDFSINDPKLREALYEYWTTHSHGAFLVKDPERIRDEFLEPEWLMGKSTQ